MNNFQEKLLSLSDGMRRASERVCQSETVSQLDIDVLRQKMREMYDFLLSADYLETKNEEKQVKEEIVELPEITPVVEIKQEEEKVEIEIVEEEVKEEIKEEEKVEIKEEVKEIELEIEAEPEQEEEKIEEVEQEEPIKEQEPVKEEEPIVEEEEVKVVEKEIEFEIEPEPEVKPEAPKTSSVLDYLHNNIMKDGDSKHTTKEKIDTTLDLFKSQPSIAESFENKTRSDLRTAIGVGEKFMFINDLFSGDLTAYTHFINMLNEASSLEMSMIIIEENKNKRKWLKNSLAYSTLENLVEKRFRK